MCSKILKQEEEASEVSMVILQLKKIKFIRLNLVLDTDIFKVKVIFQQFLAFKSKI